MWENGILDFSCTIVVFSAQWLCESFLDLYIVAVIESSIDYI